MNKIGFHIIIGLTILCSLLLLPTFSSALTTSNVAILGSGVVQYSSLNKAVYAYGLSWSDSAASFVADHFTLLDTSFDPLYLPAIQSIKAKNPNVRIIGYSNLMGIYSSDKDFAYISSNHEDWFVHDANDSRIVNTVFGWYLMDVGVLGWMQYLVSNLNGGAMSNAAYDGVFMDDVWNLMVSTNFNTTIPASVVSRWHNDTMGALQYIKANLLAGKILVMNTDEWATQDYINIVDGMMIEGYGHAYWDVDTPGSRGIYVILEQIAALSKASSMGKIVWAASGTIIPSPLNTTEVDAMVKYCYGIFLLGENGPQAYWGFNDWYSSDGSRGYYPIMDTQIGSPTGAYYYSQNTYMRDFTGGKVVVNLASSSYAVNLGGTYKLLDGTTVSSVTLNSYSGEILLSLT